MDKYTGLARLADAIAPIFEPVTPIIGEDIKNWYLQLRNRRNLAQICRTAKLKGYSIQNGPNIRVLQEALRISELGDDSDDNLIRNQYLGGLLASACGTQGNERVQIPLITLIGELSPQEILLHYWVYHCLNKMCIERDSKTPPAESRNKIFLSGDRRFHNSAIILSSKDLIDGYQVIEHYEVDGCRYPYVEAHVSQLGKLLYLTINNMNPLDVYSYGRKGRTDFEDIEGIDLPYYANDADSLVSLIRASAIKSDEADSRAQRD